REGEDPACCASNRRRRSTRVESAPGVATDRVQSNAMTSHFYLSLEVFAQTLRPARGTTVGGINETDGSLPSKRLEGMSERSDGGFEGEAFAVGAGERPCDLPGGPAV